MGFAGTCHESKVKTQSRIQTYRPNNFTDDVCAIRRGVDSDEDEIAEDIVVSDPELLVCDAVFVFDDDVDGCSGPRVGVGVAGTVADSSAGFACFLADKGDVSRISIEAIACSIWPCSLT